MIASILADESYVDLLSSTPHWLFEWSQEAVTAIALYPLAKWKAKREIAKHDRLHHPETQP